MPAEMIENKATVMGGPSLNDRETWRFLLEHKDGRVVRYRVEERAPGAEEYCFTTRRRGGDKPGVNKSEWKSWAGMRGSLMPIMAFAVGEGFTVQPRAAMLAHPDGRRFEVYVVENNATIDFREDSYKLDTRTGNGKTLLGSMWPHSWTTLQVVREQFEAQIAAHKKEGFTESAAASSKPKPNLAPMPEPADELVEWRAYWCNQGTSDKVYTVELWKRPTALSTEGSLHFVTARHGRRNGTLKELLKCAPTSKAAARAAYNEAHGERISKAYKHVLPASVNISEPAAPLLVGLPAAVPPPEPTSYDPPPGVQFICKRCSMAIKARHLVKDNSNLTARYEFGCHGRAAARTFTGEMLATFAARVGKFDAQDIAIFEHLGAPGGSTIDLGTDPQSAPATQAPAGFPHLPMPAPITVPAPNKAKAKKGTVNDAPPPKVGTLVPPPTSVHTFGMRKVKIQVGSDEDDE